MINWEPTKTPPPPPPPPKKKKKKNNQKKQQKKKTKKKQPEIFQILSPIKLYALYDIKVIACLKPVLLLLNI